MRGKTQTGQADGRDGLATGGVKPMQEMLCNNTHKRRHRQKKKLPPEQIVLDWIREGARWRDSRRVGMGGGLAEFLFIDGGVVFRDRDAVVLPGGTEQGVVVVVRSESFRRLGSPETILGRAEVGPEKDTRK